MQDLCYIDVCSRCTWCLHIYDVVVMATTILPSWRSRKIMLFIDWASRGLRKLRNPSCARKEIQSHTSRVTMLLLSSMFAQPHRQTPFFLLRAYQHGRGWCMNSIEQKILFAISTYDDDIIVVAFPSSYLSVLQTPDVGYSCDEEF